MATTAAIPDNADGLQPPGWEGGKVNAVVVLQAGHQARKRLRGVGIGTGRGGAAPSSAPRSGAWTVNDGGHICLFTYVVFVI